MASEDRKLDVLRAIVEDFVSTREPVGSKAIVERHHLGVSAATVRNDMAQLEDEGYITHPHTSAGRIPTDKGYRLFVDRLSTLKPLSAAERKAIEKFISGAVDLDDILRRSVRLLAQVTRQAAVVSYPSLSRSSVRHIELVQISPIRVMMVVITDTGRVEQRIAEVPAGLDVDDISVLRTAMNTALTGVKLADSTPVVESLPEHVDRPLRPTMTILCTVLLDVLVEPVESRIVIGGAANLTRNAADFTQTLGSVLEALEEHVVLLRLIDESARPDGLYVSIGEENEVEGLRSTALVAMAYGEQSNRLGGLGVVGPTRMDYSANISAVLTVARYIGRLLSTN